MRHSGKCILFVYLTLLTSYVFTQSEYGEDYKEEYEYYEEPTDSDYYYGDYGDDSESQEDITTEDSAPSRCQTILIYVHIYKGYFSVICNTSFRIFTVMLKLPFIGLHTLLCSRILTIQGEVNITSLQSQQPPGLYVLDSRQL